MSVDVGATTYYSEIAMVQTLDNLRRDGVLSVIDYLERMPDKLITRKQELIEGLKSSALSANQMPANDVLPRNGSSMRATNGGNAIGTVSKEGGGYAMASELDAAKKIAQLPTGMQAKYSSLPNVAQRALIR